MRDVMWKNMGTLQKFADIHLIVGFIPSVILPLIGFVATCFLVRFKEDYSNCVVKNFTEEIKEVVTNSAILGHYKSGT